MKVRIKHPKPGLAKLFSIFIPGAGQFYAGDIKNGFNSLLLTGGFLALGIYSLLFFTPFDAIVTVAPWFQRYFMGGYKRAALIAADRLNEKQNRIYLQILACFPD
jgi:TM2 domain-containing membrane protein YozV